jgi:hypothetical protein
MQIFITKSDKSYQVNALEHVQGTVNVFDFRLLNFMYFGNSLSGAKARALGPKPGTQRIHQHECKNFYLSLIAFELKLLDEVAQLIKDSDFNLNGSKDHQFLNALFGFPLDFQVKAEQVINWYEPFRFRKKRSL